VGGSNENVQEANLTLPFFISGPNNESAAVEGQVNLLGAEEGGTKAKSGNDTYEISAGKVTTFTRSRGGEHC